MARKKINVFKEARERILNDERVNPRNAVFYAADFVNSDSEWEYDDESRLGDRFITKKTEGGGEVRMYERRRIDFDLLKAEDDPVYAKKWQDKYIKVPYSLYVDLQQDNMESMASRIDKKYKGMTKDEEKKMLRERLAKLEEEDAS